MTNRALKIVHLATIIVEEVKREEFDNDRLEQLIEEFEKTLNAKKLPINSLSKWERVIFKGGERGWDR